MSLSNWKQSFVSIPGICINEWQCKKIFANIRIVIMEQHNKLTRAAIWTFVRLTPVVKRRKRTMFFSRHQVHSNNEVLKGNAKWFLEPQHWLLNIFHGPHHCLVQSVHSAEVGSKERFRYNKWKDLLSIGTYCRKPELYIYLNAVAHGSRLHA